MCNNFWSGQPGTNKRAPITAHWSVGLASPRNLPVCASPVLRQPCLPLTWALEIWTRVFMATTITLSNESSFHTLQRSVKQGTRCHWEILKGVFGTHRFPSKNSTPWSCQLFSLTRSPYNPCRPRPQFLWWLKALVTSGGVVWWETMWRTGSKKVVRGESGQEALGNHISSASEESAAESRPGRQT